MHSVCICVGGLYKASLDNLFKKCPHREITRSSTNSVKRKTLLTAGSFFMYGICTGQTVSQLWFNMELGFN